MTLFVLRFNTPGGQPWRKRGSGEGDCLSSVQWGHSEVSHQPSSSWGSSSSRVTSTLVWHFGGHFDFLWVTAFLAVVVAVKKVAEVLLQHIVLTNGHMEWLFLELEMSLPCLVSQNPNTWAKQCTWATFAYNSLSCCSSWLCNCYRPTLLAARAAKVNATICAGARLPLSTCQSTSKPDAIYKVEDHRGTCSGWIQDSCSQVWRPCPHLQNSETQTPHNYESPPRLSHEPN